MLLRLHVLLLALLAACAAVAVESAVQDSWLDGPLVLAPPDRPAAPPPSSTWFVRLADTEQADDVAAMHGMHNMGELSELPGVYSFRLVNAEDAVSAETAAAAECAHEDESLPLPAHVDARNLTSTLEAHAAIHWAEQMDNEWYYARSFYLPDPLFVKQWHLLNVGQLHGTLGEDLRVVPLWEEGLTGKGMTVAIVDDGFQCDHPDLRCDPDLSYDYVNSRQSIRAPSPTWWHGTSCAGSAIARSDSTCGVGTAYDARFAAIVLTSGAVSKYAIVRAETHKMEVVDVYNNSWGPTDDGTRKTIAGKVVTEGLKRGVTKGRDGKGVIYIWAGGNGHRAGDRADYDGLVNSIYTIGVASLDNTGNPAPYSERGSSIMIAGYGGGYTSPTTTCDLLGNQHQPGDCNEKFIGTSAAAPHIAGVVALVLQAVPQLSWIDLQHCLVHSARTPANKEMGWVRNGAGHWVSDAYGFGVMDARALLNEARAYVPYKQLDPIEMKTFTINRAIPDNGDITVTYPVDTLTQGKFRCQHVELRLTIRHAVRGTLSIMLISPAGTRATLALPNGDTHADFEEHVFMSVHFWDELPEGIWKIVVKDEKGDRSTGIVESAAFTFHGREARSTWYLIGFQVLPLALTGLAVGVAVLSCGDRAIYAIVHRDKPLDGTSFELANRSGPPGHRHRRHRRQRRGRDSSCSADSSSSDDDDADTSRAAVVARGAAAAAAATATDDSADATTIIHDAPAAASALPLPEKIQVNLPAVPSAPPLSASALDEPDATAVPLPPPATLPSHESSPESSFDLVDSHDLGDAQADLAS